MRNKKSWIWFFLVLTILAIVAIVLPVLYNLSLQLTPEELAEARTLWQQNGPENYDLDYLVRIDEDQEGDLYVAQVRDGKVVVVTQDDKPLSAEELETLDLENLTVPGLFDRMEKNLEQDRDAGRRIYATAVFDKQTGHPIRYVRRVSRTRERLEWRLTLHPPRLTNRK